jgi:hypothetical protein
MKQYRLYTLNERSQIVGPPRTIQADTDEDAIAIAKQLRLQHGLDMELREDARIVTPLKAGTI